MQTENHQEGWVYVIVHNPDKDGKYAGMEDTENNIRFIPAFTSKEEAMNGMLRIPREEGVKSEIHAAHRDDLAEHARQNGMLVFLLDSDGRVLEKF